MLAASAALAIASGGGAAATAWSWWAAPAEAPHDYLDGEEAAFLVALAAALFPPGGTPALGGDVVGADRFVDQLMGCMPEFQRGGLKLLINALDNLAYLNDLKPFRSLDRDEAERRVWSWLAAPLAEQRSAVQSLVMLVAMAYTTHPDVSPHFSRWTGCGYGL